MIVVDLRPWQITCTYFLSFIRSFFSVFKASNISFFQAVLSINYFIAFVYEQMARSDRKR